MHLHSLAQFDGVERVCKEDATPSSVKQQTLRSVKSWTPKSLRLSPPSSPKASPVSDSPKVDPSVPLELQRCVYVCACCHITYTSFTVLKAV